MEKFFDVRINIDSGDSEFKVQLYDITQKDEYVGEIIGNIKHEVKSGLKVFTVYSSELDDNLHGKGYGLKMYECIIKKIFSIWPNSEFKSSTNLNKMSRGVWESLTRKYYNVKKVGKIYVVSKPEKGIL